MKKRLILAYFLINAACFLVTDAAYAKDLFVAPSGGSDSVTWASNNISNPWATVEKAFKSAQAGDIVYFRGGNYTITSEIYNSTAKDGTADSPIIFKNYNNETVTISGSCNGKSLIRLETNYYYVDGLNFVGRDFTSGRSIFFVAENSDATNFKATNCTFTIESSSSVDNVASITLQASRSRDAYIENCTFTGPNKNNGIIIFRSTGVIVNNCEFGNLQYGIYYKHSNTLVNSGIAFTNNYVHDCQQGFRMVSNYALMRNNLFVGCGIYMGDDGGIGDGGVGGDYNTIEHNTFYNGSVTLLHHPDDGGCLHNVIKNNIFMVRSDWHRYTNISADIQSDYNLYPTGNAVIQNRIDYTLPAWVIRNSRDARSLSGWPTFVGGSGISAYGLTSNSVGKNAASDGKDMGADVTLVGVYAGGQTYIGNPIPGNLNPVRDFKMADPGQSLSSLTNECRDYKNLHPDWIFCDDFESEASLVGNERYFEYNNNNGDFVPQAGVGVDESRGMKVAWQAGEVDAGSFSLGFGRNPSNYMNKNVRSGENFREIYYRMYLKNESGWQGSPAKLSRASVIARSDWSQAMIAHLWSSDSGNVTLAIDPASCVENGVVQCNGWNDFNNLTWLGIRSGVTPIFSSEQSGQWKCIEVHVRLNDPNQSNGIHEFWIDGERQARSTNLNFTGTYTEYGLNYLAFENYWNSGSPKEQRRYFDNIVVSTSPIGCQ